MTFKVSVEKGGGAVYNLDALIPSWFLAWIPSFGHMGMMLRLAIISGIAGFFGAILMPMTPRWSRKIILVMYLIIMASLTLFRDSQSVRRIILIPFWSYRQWGRAEMRWQIYMNYFLFIPYGAILKSLRTKHPILLALMTSVMIELLQFIFALGLCEADDVIGNTLGAAIGCAVYWAVAKAISFFRNLVRILFFLGRTE